MTELQLVALMAFFAWAVFGTLRKIILAIVATIITLPLMIYLFAARPSMAHLRVLKLVAAIWGVLEVFNFHFNIIRNYKHARLFLMQELMKRKMIQLKQMAEQAENPKVKMDA